ncbi:MAG: transcriptional regulator [Bradyrhizobium sp.]
MGHQVRPHQAKAWRSGDGQRLWLSSLIETMEQVSRPGVRAMPCDRTILSALSMHLARPATPYPYWHARQASDFSLRN